MTDPILHNVRPGCLEPEQMAAYLDGCLSEGEQALVERHAAACAACAELLVASAETLMAPDDPRLERLETLCRHRLP